MAMVRERTWRPTAIVVASLAASGGLLLLPMMLGLLRGELHQHCQWMTMDGFGEWVCPDGITYLGSGFLVLVAYVACAVVGIVLVASGRVRRAASAALLPGATVVLISISAVAGRPVTHGVVDWRGPMLLPTVAIAVASLAIVAAVSVPSSRWRHALLTVAACCVVAAIAVQYMIAAFGVLALGLLAAALVLQQPPRSPRIIPPPVRESAYDDVPDR